MSIISEEQIIKIMRQYNPWWKNPLSVKNESKTQKRLAYYEALNIIGQKTIRRFLLLSGARRVGKTTIMYQIIEKLINDGINPKNILYISFDNPMIKMVNSNEVLKIFDSLYTTNGMKYIFFDEIQYAENWELWLKVIYDARKDICVVATGSASPVLEKGSSESGTGRWTVLKIPTLSFYEYCRLLELEEPALPKNLKNIGTSAFTQPEGESSESPRTTCAHPFSCFITIILSSLPSVCTTEESKLGALRSDKLSHSTTEL